MYSRIVAEKLMPQKILNILNGRGLVYTVKNPALFQIKPEQKTSLSVELPESYRGIKGIDPMSKEVG
jgi:hypothetical protein